MIAQEPAASCPRRVVPVRSDATGFPDRARRPASVRSAPRCERVLHLLGQDLLRARRRREERRRRQHRHRAPRAALPVPEAGADRDPEAVSTRRRVLLGAGGARQSGRARLHRAAHRATAARTAAPRLRRARGGGEPRHRLATRSIRPKRRTSSRPPCGGLARRGPSGEPRGQHSAARGVGERGHDRPLAQARRRHRESGRAAVRAGDGQGDDGDPCASGRPPGDRGAGRRHGEGRDRRGADRRGRATALASAGAAVAISTSAPESRSTRSGGADTGARPPQAAPASRRPAAPPRTSRAHPEPGGAATGTTPRAA